MSHSCHKYSRHHSTSPSSLLSWYSSTSRSSSSRNSSSSWSRSRKHRRRDRDEYWHRYHRHQRHHQKEYNLCGSMFHLYSCPKRIIAHVRKGNFVQFDLLLPSTGDVIPVQAARPTNQKKPSSHKRKITDFQSWMETWNIFLLSQSHTSPHLCLELLKYQTLIGHLFSAYPVSVRLHYDQLF